MEAASLEMLAVVPWGWGRLGGVWRRESPQILVVWRWGEEAWKSPVPAGWHVDCPLPLEPKVTCWQGAVRDKDVFLGHQGRGPTGCGPMVGKVLVRQAVRGAGVGDAPLS